MTEESEKSALDYHRFPKPGKVEITPTKPLANQRDLALAYSPGVAEPCKAIATDNKLAAELTSRANLVAVVSNGTAVLGLGDIGPLASKPVMEGKGVLFKKFAGIDVFDIEINEKDPAKLVEIIASLEPTFGGINLEDIRSPECFLIERELSSKMKIPVFHDDQHGTAIIVSAGVLNGLELVGKKISDIKLVVCGAGAAAISCLKLLNDLGIKKENIFVVDRLGVIQESRSDISEHKREFASKTKYSTLTEVMKGADIFLGLSGPGLVKPAMIRSMAENPLVFALSNPIPEILPEEVQATRSDAIIATGRSDYPNQVNNVLCFPFIFRGALDVGATKINDEMKIALVQALADLAKEETPVSVVAAYGGEELKFGREYLIPKPFDPRLIIKLAPATAQAAMDSGVATRPIEDMDIYKEHLSHYIFETVILMKPLFEKAKDDPKKIIYAEGDETKILHAVQSVLDEGLAKPILVGKEEVIESRIKQMGLRIRLNKDITTINPHEYIAKKNINIDNISEINTYVATHMINAGDADALICGTNGHYHEHFNIAHKNLGVINGINQAAAVNVVMVKKGVFFICDTAVTIEPTAQQIAENTLLAAETVRRFGITPRVALLSFSNGDDTISETSKKMISAMKIIQKQNNQLEVAAPIRADAALLGSIRRRVFPYSKLEDDANLLMMPNLDSAKIAYDMIKVLGEGVSIGPILVGLNHPVHILTASSTVRRIVNATAIAAVDSQIKAAESGLLL